MLTPRLRSAGFDLLIGVGVAGLTCLGIFARQTPRATMALGFAMAVAILFRRVRPLSALAVISSVALLQVFLFPPAADPLPFDLAVLIGMYSVVKYGRSLYDGYVAGLVVAIGIAIEVLRHPEAPFWALTLWYIGVCGGTWLMAYSFRNRRIYVRSLEERAATLEREREHLARIAVADERAAIARELHDVVAHSLAVMIVQADGGRYAFDSDPAQAREALATVADTGREALEDMRRLVAVLRGSDEPSTVDDRRLHTLSDLVDRARSAGMRLDDDIRLGPLSPAVELTVYRVTQEALTNVLRHAGPQAQVTLVAQQHAEAVSLSVVDDGGGRVAPLARGSGHGLTGMRERVAVHQGRLHAGPRPQGGWSIEVSLPLSGIPTAPTPADALQEAAA